MSIRSVILLVVLIAWGCKPTKPTTGIQQDGKYTEDLSAQRPKIEEQPENVTVPGKAKRDPKEYVEPHYTVNKPLDAVLDSIDRINLTRKFIEGYTIQVYSGMKREDALNVKKQLLTTLPEFESELQYSQPNYRVKMGKYYSRLEAEKDYQLVKKYFKAAILVPDKIAVN
ncbi:MAG TPA: SPOR domain-containing protein [Cyclobacteriaceae bacterium]|nr:SPOR domain-containing protein [Cyclobacteriaceae bacterium]